MDCVPNRWSDLPSDILSTIAGIVGPLIGILRLRSVCKSWRSSLALPIPHFPLTLPSPSALSLSSHLSLHRLTLFLLSPPADPSLGFLFKVHQLASNTFTLLNPLSNGKHRKPTSPINLLDYRVIFICDSYVVEHVNSRVSDSNSLGLHKILIKKVVVQRGFFQEGDFVVLCLTDDGKLLLWKFGDEGWTEIGPSNRRFDDIIAYKGKFYATADKRGRLVLIDSRLQPMDLVKSLMYGCGECTYLLESDGLLYLIDYIHGYKKLEIGVFKFDDKCRFWDYELSLDHNVFFVGSDVNFSVSKTDYFGDVRNCIYFITNIYIPEGNDGRDFTAVLDMKKGTIHPLFGSNKYCSLYWPPSGWFL